MSAQSWPRPRFGAIVLPPVALTRPLDALVRTTSERFAVLAWATPTNAAREHSRLVDDWSNGRETSPRWTDPLLDRAAVARTMHDLDRARKALASTTDPWLQAYARRLDEIALDVALVEASFAPDVVAAARRRFAATAEEIRGADRIAREWIAAEPHEAAQETIASDDETDPRSLVQRMRSGISARKLGVRVLLRDRIGALAAAGDGLVIVARGCRTTEREAARVVLHEIEGHLLPRERARGVGPGLRMLGSAGASEDEEGRALLLEQQTNPDDGRRRRTLAARHIAARLVENGASFRDATRTLRDDHALSVVDALGIVGRVMRGAFTRGGEVYGGVMRERVYLPAFLRVQSAVADGRVTLDTLGSARLSLAARALLPAEL